MRKKGQVEIIGLTIVIILITLGMLFVIKFVVLKEPDNIRTSYTRTQMASNMLNAMLRTNTGCRGKTVTELLQSCATMTEIDCGGIGSCQYVNDTIEALFADTFDVWKIEYQFTVRVGDGDYLTNIISSSGACQGEKESKPFFIPVGVTTTINLKLDLCS